MDFSESENSQKDPHVIKADDVCIADNKDKVMFILYTSKTHWKDVEPQVVTISSIDITGTDSRLNNYVISKKRKNKCPFQLLRDYIKVRRTIRQPDEQLFIFHDRSPVTPTHMRDILKQALSLNGLEPENYGCHSYRIGCAVDLHTHYHLDVGSIKKLGRWKSNIVYNYLKL